MKSFKTFNNVTGWLVFAIGTIVYVLTAEKTGSLWDCGEFIAGCYKLQVVHPPGAPLFLMIGRLFTAVAEIFTNDGAMIAYTVNIMSGVFTALGAMFVCWSTSILATFLFHEDGKTDELSFAQIITINIAGLVAGLTTLFATSIWFSAVEGEVYAMSTAFTAMVFWAMLKWYHADDTNPLVDKWLILVALLIGLSIGVHLLSLLTIPALSMLYYYKKYKNRITWAGGIIAFMVGAGLLVVVQSLIILKLPKLGAFADKLFVNDFGLPIGSGLLFFSAIIVGLIIFSIYFTTKNGYYLGQKISVAVAMIMIGFSTYGMIVVRAKANTPINMNDPSNSYSLVSYLNREQYGDRPLVIGPHYRSRRENDAAGNPKYNETPKWGLDGDKYGIIDTKTEYVYKPSDRMLFPRLGHMDRAQMYDAWLGLEDGQKPSFSDNIAFFFRYHVNWMYLRYLYWNFVGRQNGNQGQFDWNKADGNWISGVPFVDSARLYDQSNLPDVIKNDKGRNTYFFIPLLLGIIGLVFHSYKRKQEFIPTLIMFLMTGVVLILYTNSPPSEPRERDYVYTGSIFTFCIWIGLAVPAIYQMLASKLKGSIAIAGLSSLACLSAPTIMAFQNWDDHTRANLSAARDYASNFLMSCDKDAIIFTYGDNDTYPLWYAQEVEGIRTDVRVVNLSLIQVDWYIDQLRRKVNDSPPIKLSISQNAYTGEKRNVVYYLDRDNVPIMPLKEVIKFVGESHPVQVGNGQMLDYYLPSKKFVLPVPANLKNPNDTTQLDNLVFGISENGIFKDDLAILDLIASNFGERPIYFAVTVRPEKIQGLQNYLQLEGLGLKLVPKKTKSLIDQSGMLGLVYSGDFNDEKTYDILMNKFKWGGFDKHHLFVDESLQPATSIQKALFMRTIENYIRKEDPVKAKKLLDKYMTEAFTFENFPDDYNKIYLVEFYFKINDQKSGHQYLKQLAQHFTSLEKFYNGLDEETIAYSFGTDKSRNGNILKKLNELSLLVNDEKQRKEIIDILSSVPSEKLEK